MKKDIEKIIQKSIFSYFQFFLQRYPAMDIANNIKLSTEKVIDKYSSVNPPCIFEYARKETIKIKNMKEPNLLNFFLLVGVSPISKKQLKNKRKERKHFEKIILKE